jgi:hypothetical protein
MSHPDALDPHARRDMRGLRIAFWVGIAVGLLLAVPRYGLFSMSTVTVVGLLLITSIAVYAAIVALSPARPVTAPERPDSRP